MYNSIGEFGYHCIVGLAGADLTEEERNLLGELRPTGLILFAKNIDRDAPDWPDRLRCLCAEVRGAARRPDMLISVDHEGGRVHRFPDTVTHFPPASLWGNRAGEVGAAMGRELKTLGFNLNFAPVLDCFSEPKNTVIGDRALSCSFDGVADNAISFAKAMEAEGVLSCGKHFPGHGATIADSHFELPVLESDRRSILENELLPFKKYISAGFPLMMVAHVLYPSLDPEYPGTLSSRIIRELLREELGFSGAVVSDDLEMKALARYSPAEKAVLALQAGVDLLLEGNCRDHPPLARAWEMAHGLHEAVKDGRILQSIMQESRARIQSLLAYAASLGSGPPSEDILGCAAHKALCEAIRAG